MSSLVTVWNKSSLKVPDDKGASGYAIEREKLFPRNSSICDLGGGGGEDSVYFINQGHEVVLIDISDVGIKRAKLKAPKNLTTIQLDFSSGNFPLPDNKFDVVYSRLSLHYFLPERLSEIYKEIFRILKPGGSAYLVMKSSEDEDEIAHLKKTAIQIEEGVYKDGEFMKTRFSKEKLKHILHTSGVKNYKVQLYKERFNKYDKIKSGKTALLLDEVIIYK